MKQFNIKPNLLNNKQKGSLKKKYSNINNIQKDKIEEDLIGENIDNESQEAEEEITNKNNIILSHSGKNIMKWKNSPPIKKYISINNEKKNDKNNENSFSRNILVTKNDNNFKLNKKLKSTNNILSNAEKARIKYILKYNDKELNDLEYKQALKFDNRTYFDYYFSLLKTKHMIFIVINKNDYNSQMIKIYLCFFNFGLCYIVNALFFSDETMHQIYQDGGDFNFIYQLPQNIFFN